jgi:hypothetical protein
MLPAFCPIRLRTTRLHRQSVKNDLPLPKNDLPFGKNDLLFLKNDLPFCKNDLPLSKNDLLFVHFLYKKEQALF